MVDHICLEGDVVALPSTKASLETQSTVTRLESRGYGNVPIVHFNCNGLIIKA
jgi:predicted aconitase with swiveling domain